MCNVARDECLHYDYVRLAWDIGFNFEDTAAKSVFDIGIIGLVDVDRVIRERDIPAVLKHVPTLLNFRLDEEIGKVLEPNFVKLFKLSQLSIQYLKFCIKYLDTTVAILKNELAVANEEKEEMEMYITEIKHEHDNIQRKFHELQATVSTNVFKCDECNKTFYSEEYLEAHVKRRHENVQQMQTEADKLQLEIKELKQRLNSTEKLIKHEKETSIEKDIEKEKSEPNNDNAIEDSIQLKFEQLKNHIEAEINSLRDEDFYRNICEKYMKERTEKKPLSHIQIPPVVIIPEKKDASVEIVEERVPAFEAFTQTDSKTAVINAGTSMSPQPSPRKIPPELGDKGEGDEISNKSNNESKIIEEKLAREVELQRETLEQILDLKLSGSLNKMEAQMNAFWQKLNAWESNLARPIKSSSESVINLNGTTGKQTVENDEDALSLRKQKSMGSIVSSNLPPKPKPRHINAAVRYAIEKNATNSRPLSQLNEKSVIKVVKPEAKRIPQKVSESCSSEEASEKTETSETIPSKESLVEQSNLKPSQSFKKRLDDALQQRLKSKLVKSPINVTNPDPITVVTSRNGVTRQQSKDNESIASSPVSLPQQERRHDDSLHDMKKRLKRHIEESVNQKLLEIGVSSHWKGIPEKSYNRALQIVEHQAGLSIKNIHDFHKIRRNIEKAIDVEMKRTQQEMKSKKDNHARHSSPKKIENLVPTPPESNQASNSSIRKSQETTPKKIQSEISSVSSNASSIQQIPLKSGVTQVRTIAPREVAETKPSPSVNIRQISEANGTVQNKKKVLFNLDSDLEGSPVKNFTVGHTNLGSSKTTNVKAMNDSESDWDISEIT